MELHHLSTSRNALCRRLLNASMKVHVAEGKQRSQCRVQTVESADENKAAHPMRYTSISGLVSGMVNLHF